MLSYRLMTSLWLGLGLFALAGCGPQSQVVTSQAQVPPVEPGMAGV
jgi:hypothetical protein